MKKMVKLKSLLLVIFFTVIIFNLSGKLLINNISKKQYNSLISAEELQSILNTTTFNTALSTDLNFELHSEYAILINLDESTIIYEKNSQEKCYPASLTKIMTTIVAIENIDDLNSTIQLSPSIYESLISMNASMAGFKPNESVTVTDLLYGAMLPSGGECSIQLAHTISGSEEDFAKLMNDKADEIGMTNSNFVNPTGLHHDDQYTTVEDIAKLVKYALDNDIFTQIFTTDYYSASDNGRASELILKSTMFQKLEKENITNEYILGGKTGYTSEAGLCLASMAEIDGTRYILVTAKADGNTYSQQYNVIDADNVYNKVAELIFKEE